MDLAELIDPRTTALVVVDVQEDYCRQASRAQQEFVDAAVGRMIDLLEAARRAGVQVVHVQTRHGEADTSPTWLDRHNARSGGRPLPCRPGTPGADPYRLTPAPGEPVVIKHRYDGFIGTDLDVLLRSRGVRTVVGVGINTDVCVDCTLRHAFMLDYAVVVPRDAVASDSLEGHEHALRQLHRYYARVVDAEEILRAWRPAGRLAG
jgi:ureidoacrylate peracid hydrolase